MCHFLYFILFLCLRIGEAANPGPACNTCVIGVANPSGVANKVEMCLELDRGIWSFAETQATEIGFHRFAKAMKAFQPSDRSLSLVHGAFAPPRVGSLTAGSWTGVCHLSDFPVRPLVVPWRGFEFESGRSLISAFQLGVHTVLGAAIYAPPSGPTYGNAKGLTNELLSTLTEELIIGQVGPRFVAGDFNLGSMDLDTFAHWRSLGWTECQDLAAVRFGRSHIPTCKHSTAPDQIWLSPELQEWVLGVDSNDQCFPDHATLQVQIQIPSFRTWTYEWFQPSILPWSSLPVPVDQLDFGSQDPFAWNSADLTGSFKSWSCTAEAELLHGFEPYVPVHKGFRGRGCTSAH